MKSIPNIKNEFTNRYGKVFHNINEIAYKKGELYNNLGKLVAETKREQDSFLVPDDFDLRGVYIYQQLDNPDKAYRIYKEFAEYKFNGYNDDKLIENLQQKQTNIKLTEFPSGVVTLDGMIIGQEIPYYDGYKNLYDALTNINDKRTILMIYKKIIKILKELYDNGIIYTDVHAKNFMVNNDNVVKLIDFEYSQVKFEMNDSFKMQLMDNLRNMINILNLHSGIDYVLERIMKFEDFSTEIDVMKRRLK